MAYFWLGILAEDIEPYCDGDFENMECIEDDGFVTCHFSGPIRELPDDGSFAMFGTKTIKPKQVSRGL